jgi:hypothetical protein
MNKLTQALALFALLATSCADSCGNDSSENALSPEAGAPAGKIVVDTRAEICRKLYEDFVAHSHLVNARDKDGALQWTERVHLDDGKKGQCYVSCPESMANIPVLDDLTVQIGVNCGHMAGNEATREALRYRGQVADHCTNAK